MGEVTKYYISSTKYSIQERQTKRYGKVYDLVFRVLTPDGVEHQKKLSGYGTKTKAKEAYLSFVSKNCELVKNNPIRKKTHVERHDLIFGELAKQYLLSLHNQNKESTIYEKHKIFELWFYPEMHGMKMKDMTREYLLRWQDKIWSSTKRDTGEHYSYKYLTKIRTCLSAFLEWCAERYPDECRNYISGIKLPKRRAAKKEMQIWTRDDFNKFIAEVDDPMYKALFATAFYTGRREGEILALSPKDVDLDKKTIAFKKSLTRKTTDGTAYKITTTKTELKSTTMICNSLAAILAKYEPGEPFYFGGERPVADNSLRRAFYRYSKKAGLPKIRVHDLRHSFVSMCIHLGAPLPVVADLIGDTIEQVTKTYAHMYASDKERVIAAIG